MADPHPRTDPTPVTSDPVTITDIAAFTARLRALSSPALRSDPADRAELLSDKADLLARIAHQHARTDPALADQARAAAGPARAAADPNPNPGRAREPNPTSASTPISARPETRCAAPGCTATLTRTGRGRPARYCSPTCRTVAQREHRRDRDQPLSIEVDHGSTSAKGQRGGRVWLVRLRRGHRAVIINTGLARSSADHLAHQISQLLHPTSTARLRPPAAGTTAVDPPSTRLETPRPDHTPPHRRRDTPRTRNR